MCPSGQECRCTTRRCHARVLALQAARELRASGLTAAIRADSRDTGGAGARARACDGYACGMRKGSPAGVPACGPRMSPCAISANRSSPMPPSPAASACAPRRGRAGQGPAPARGAHTLAQGCMLFTTRAAPQACALHVRVGPAQRACTSVRDCQQSRKLPQTRTRHRRAQARACR